tara:strand:+ start:164 stop:445 length:282 start_codon:yes stop_codon:yes gene_type:complete
MNDSVTSNHRWHRLQGNGSDMSDSEHRELLQEIRRLRGSIDELNGLLRSIFTSTNDNLPTRKQTSKKKKRSAGAVEKESGASKPHSPTPGRHF